LRIFGLTGWWMVCVGLGALGLVCARAGLADSPCATELAGEFVAQQAGQEAAAGSVSGRVIWVGIGAGIRKVVVKLERVNAEGQTAQDYVTSTDIEGRFRFEGVAAGTYGVTLQRAGFVRTGTKPEEPPVTVTAGQETSGLLYKMEATGVIAGKITEADGDPLPGVSVWVSRVGKSGAAEFGAHEEVDNETGQEATNDLGEFRIANLKAGQYIVQAQAHGMNPAPDPADKGKQKDLGTYALTYFPGTTDTKAATPIQVTAGGTASANFSVLTSRTYHVSGTVTVAGNPRNIQMYLVSTTGQTEAVGLNEGGRFEFAGVLPGTYVAQIVDMSAPGNGGAPETHTQMIGSPIVVSNSDVSGLVLQPEAGGSVNGKVRTEDGSTLEWRGMNISLVRVPQDEELPQLSDIGALGGSAALKEDGSFEMKDVAGAMYLIFMGGQSSQFGDYYLKSVMVDGRETVDTGFEVRAATTVDVVLGAKGAEVDGTVVDADGNGLGGVTVMSLPPVGKQKRMDLYQRVETDATGHFSMKSIPPGAYVIVAIQEAPDNPWTPEFLSKYGDKGELVDLGEGDKKSIVVKIVVEGE
jgi:hypothetical protein